MAVLASVLLLPATVVAQNAYVDFDWPREVVGSMNQNPARFSVAATSTGGPAYVVARSASPYSLSPKIKVQQVLSDSTNGFSMYLPSLLSSTDADGVAIISNENGETVFVTGWIKGSNGKDIYTASIDTATGTLNWEKSFNGNANDDDVPVTILWDDASSFVYVGGTSDHTISATTPDFVVLKLNTSNGSNATNWSTPFYYNGTGNGKDTLADLKFINVAGAGGAGGVNLLYAAGTSYSSGASAHNFMTIQIDPADPTTYIAKPHDAGSADILTGLAIYADTQTSGLVAVTGYTNGSGSGNNDYLTVAYPLNLATPAWSATYNGAGNASDQAVNVGITGNGDQVVVTGESWGGILRSYDFVTRAYDATNGGITWTDIYNHPTASAEDRATDLLIDKNDNVYIGGKSYNGTSLDFCAISYRSDGARRWIERVGGVPTSNEFVLHNGPSNGTDFAGALRVSLQGPIDHDGDVFLFGSADNSGKQFRLIKYKQEDR